MERNPELRLTADGSPTLYLPGFDETYHSRHGAMQESLHVFIEAGLLHAMKHFGDLKILELGFGSGLNALLTYKTTKQIPGMGLHYTALEPYPLSRELASEYLKQLPTDFREQSEEFRMMHECETGEIDLSADFKLNRHRAGFVDFITEQKFNLIYFDAFAPRVQPELWTEDIFLKLWAMMEPGGIWVSYCAKGSVRRALQSAGFFCERLAGPKGKREMLRARKMPSLRV